MFENLGINTFLESYQFTSEVLSMFAQILEYFVILWSRTSLDKIDGLDMFVELYQDKSGHVNRIISNRIIILWQVWKSFWSLDLLEAIQGITLPKDSFRRLLKF